MDLLGIGHVTDSLIGRNGPRLGGPNQHGDVLQTYKLVYLTVRTSHTVF